MFYSCESTYLGYPSVQGFGNDVIRFHGSVVFGSFGSSNWSFPFRQVRLAGNDSCLVVDSENGVVLSACSTVDDASQTSQFWTVLQNKTEPAPLNFIGNITNDVDNPSAAFYSFGYGYLGGNPVVSGEQGSCTILDTIIDPCALQLGSTMVPRPRLIMRSRWSSLLRQCV